MKLTNDQWLALVTGLVQRIPEYIALGEQLIALFNGKEPTPEEMAQYEAALDAAYSKYEADVLARRAEG